MMIVDLFFNLTPPRGTRSDLRFNVLIYQNDGKELDAAWRKAGFEVLGRFSWKNYLEDLQGVRPFEGEPPDLLLMSGPRPK